MKRTVLVSGGAGFVGSSLCLAFKRDFPNYRIIALDNLRRRGSELSAKRILAGGVEFIHGDLRNPEDIASVGSFDLLLDCAAEPSVHAGYDGSASYVTNTNLVGTIHMLEAARKYKADVVFLSSSRIYPIAALRGLKFTEGKTRFDLSGQQKFPGVSAKGISESFPLSGSRSLYGATKLCSELLLEEYGALYGLRTLVNRCGVIAGPWQMGQVDQGFVSLWMARHFYGGKLSYIGFGGEGKQVRDILHVSDLYELLKIQIEQLERLKGQVFNVGGGQEVSASLLEMTELCQKITGKKIPIDKIADTRAADIPIYVTDNTKVQAETGWKATSGVEQIANDIHDWIKDNSTELASIFKV